MADIEYSQSPEGFQLLTRLAQSGGGGGGMDQIAAMYQDAYARKLADQERARVAAISAAQPRASLGAGAGRSKASMEDEDFKRAQQQMQLKAMRAQMYDASRERHKANLKAPRLVEEVGGPQVVPGLVRAGEGSTRGVYGGYQ